MNKVKVAAFSLSADGFGAGPEQSMDDPFGKRGGQLNNWQFETQAFRRMIGQGGGTTGVDNAFVASSMEGFGAFIMGRNMFGPVRGEWTDDEWKGWWGDNPPYHEPTFILTHHRRDSIVMEGGTTFHFVTEGIEDALERAKEAAGNRDVKITGGGATIRQYLMAGLVDEMHFATVPVLLGEGEALFHGIDLPSLGYRISNRQMGEGALHLVVTR